MKRIEISEELRRKAAVTNDTHIILADPRDIISLVDKVNEIVDVLNRTHPGEISNERLRDFLST